MKTLVIAEKPSVAQDIVRALTPTVGKFEKHKDYFENDRYVVTSAVGHLVEIQAPEQYEVKRGKWSFTHLPVIPPFFDLKPVEKSKGRLEEIVKQAKRKEINALVNACDAGREGELIFRLIDQYAGKGNSLGKPIQRLWLQSMTPQSIRDGFAHLRSDGQMQGLADAARSRAEADWLVGINGTRAMTAFNSRDGGFFLTTVGRVQTPTLAIVVEREEQIRRHVARDYWEVHAEFKVQAGNYWGKWFDPNWKKDPLDAERKADRLWEENAAQLIASAVRGKTCTVTEESKPATQLSPLLFDLTSLQREANARFGFSAKTTLTLAQTLYERHKALTYPRTDSRHLPEDYLNVVEDTFKMLAASKVTQFSPWAKKALDSSYIKPSRRIFDNSKVSDHFAIIPTLEMPGTLSETEQKIYEMVVLRFMAVFYPSAEFRVTTRITTANHEGLDYLFRSEGKVLVQPGWLALYGKEALDTEGKDSKDNKDGKDGKDAKDSKDGKSLVPIQPGERALNQRADVRALQTRPPARYSEATLLGVMESAGKLVEDDELRGAMQEKGLGTPATRATIIEGLLTEKYILREGREMVPTAKAFQLMTLLRGLQVEELTRPELTGEWEFKLAQIEQGKISRATFMHEIAAMTERVVKKAKEYSSDSVPGDYVTLTQACPNCSGVMQENYRRFACIGFNGGQGCGFSFSKTPAGRTFSAAEADLFLRDRHIGPLDGFRSKKGTPFVAELSLVHNEQEGQYKLEFDFGEEAQPEEGAQPVDFSQQPSLGPCPKCKAPVRFLNQRYVCEHSIVTASHPQVTCDFKTGQTVLQQIIDDAQVHKLLTEGRTDLLGGFVSQRTRRPFKARLAWSAKEGKVVFEFETRQKVADATAAEPISSPSPDPSPPPPAAKPTAPVKATATSRRAPAASAPSPASSKTAKRTTKSGVAPKKPAAWTPVPKPKAPEQPPRQTSFTPSAELAAIVGSAPLARDEIMKRLWNYINEHGLNDKRVIWADNKLRPIIGADSISMFRLPMLLGKHLT